MAKGEENKSGLDNKERLKELFGRFFERFDLKDEKKLVKVMRIGIFSLIIVLEALVYMQLFSGFEKESNFFAKLVVFSGGVLVFDLAQALNTFAVKGKKATVALYAVDVLALVCMIATTGNSYLCILYMLVLTELYVTLRKAKIVTLTLAIALPLYVVVNWLSLTIFLGRSVSYTYVISNTIGALILLVLHFFIVNFGLGFYRQYVRLAKALKDLDENKTELKKANEELLQAAATLERQRIAKEIHDTAGHSITTVIMQTEAAKLVLEENPEEAKKRIVAANLQAKHALEELRESVHLLSGRGGEVSLKTALEQIVQESTDGTDIKIRHSFDEIKVDAETHRFFCNALKEGIANGLRHGKATAFWAELKQTEKGVEFLLSDNGVGVRVERLQKGFGLSSMAQHAERLGGRAEFSSEEGEGFEIRISIEGKTNEN